MIQSGNRPCPMAVALGSTVLVLARPVRHTVVVLHPVGLWFEADADAFIEATPAEAQAVARAFRAALKQGFRGQCDVALSKAEDGTVTAKAFECTPSLPEWMCEPTRWSDR